MLLSVDFSALRRRLLVIAASILLIAAVVPRIATAGELDEALAIAKEDRDNAMKSENIWLFLRPYEAKYEIRAKGKSLGFAYRKVTRADQEWQINLSSKLKYIVTFTSSDLSKFTVADQHLKVLSHVSRSKVTSRKERVVSQNFDWANKKETGKRKDKTWELPLDKPIYDRTTHVLQMRAELMQGKNSDFVYPVSYKGKRKTYAYDMTPATVLDLNVGQLQAVKISRTAGNESEFAMWLSPELNYLPVQISQLEPDQPSVIMKLVSLRFAD